MPPPLLPLLRDPRRFVQRLKLYSKRVAPLRRPWLEDSRFAGLYSRMRGHTLASRERCFTLYELVRVASAVDGDFAEAGVFRGGTALLLAELARAEARVPRRSIHLFDTFAGMPATSLEHDLHQEGDFADTSLEAVRRFVGSDLTYFHPGFFPSTAAAVSERRFALVHVDMDIAKSVMDACEFFYERMTPGGVLVFDDYGEASCPGATWAVDTFFADKRERVFRCTTGQALVTKLP